MPGLHHYSQLPVNLPLDKTYYLILGQLRSGTTAIHLISKGHPNISAINDEVIIQNVLEKGINIFTYGNSTQDEVAKSQWAMFRFLAEYNRTDASLAFGMKSAVGEINDLERTVSILSTKLSHVSIIGCIRSDLLAQYASLKRAETTGKWHSWSKSKTTSSKSLLKIDPIKYSQYYIKGLRMITLIRSLQLSNPYLEVGYDDIQDDVSRVAPKIFDFLGVPTLEPSWFASKKVSPPPQEFVINYQQIRDIERHIADAGAPDGRLSARSILRKLRNRAQKIF